MIVRHPTGLTMLPIKDITLNEAKQIIITTDTKVQVELMDDEVKDVLREIVKHCRVVQTPTGAGIAERGEKIE